MSDFTGNGIDAPAGITTGPDGALWFTNLDNNSIGRITTAGAVSNYTDPSIDSRRRSPPGPTERSGSPMGNNSIGRITTAGIVTNYTGTGIDSPTVDHPRARWGALVHQS